jgi:uncharacterized cupredoxin-like copper-binding protein
MHIQSYLLALASALVVGGTAAHAHGNAEHTMSAEVPTKYEQKPWGIAGERTSARRMIEIGMTDAMRFVPEHIELRLGETIRFVHRNDGKVLHEFVLGTKTELDEHAAMMKKFPGMEHDEPYMAHVPPGETREIVWTFNRAGTFDFACLIPGHYDAGMVGRVVVTPPVSR